MLALLLLVLPTSAQGLDDTPVEALTLRFDSRYDSIDWGQDAHRLQNSALVSFQVDLFAGIDLAGMASTGHRFQSRWSTWRDLQGDEPERMALSLRQLYLERWFGEVARVQAGSIPPVKGRVSTSGLEDIGWIDGVRLETHHPFGLDVEVVGGSLTDVDEPDLFIRERELDYAELELGWQAPMGIETEAAFHMLGGSQYAKAELGWSGELGPARWVEVRLEGGVELESTATQAVASLATDLGTLVTGNVDLDGYLRFDTHCRWVDPDYGLFGTLGEDFYQFGTECRFRLRGQVDPGGRVGWNVRYIAPVSEGLAPRFDAGITARLRLRRGEG